LSLRGGGEDWYSHGGSGHLSHQNGLDADLYYPRKEGRERAPTSVDQIDMPLAQQLVDLFVSAGAEYVFVGPNTPLTGPPDVVQPWYAHDDHLHVRLPAAPS
jgi:murein endopeptidase